MVLEVPRQVLLQQPLVPQHEGLHQKQLAAQCRIGAAYEGLGGAGGQDAIGPRANVGLGRSFQVIQASKRMVRAG